MRTRAAAAAIGRALAETGEPLARARFLPAQIEILLAARDREGARAACGELAEIAARFDTDMLRATTAQAQGAVELAAGNPREALVQLRFAWKEWQALDAAGPRCLGQVSWRMVVAEAPAITAWTAMLARGRALYSSGHSPD